MYDRLMCSYLLYIDNVYVYVWNCRCRDVFLMEITTMYTSYIYIITASMGIPLGSAQLCAATSL